MRTCSADSLSSSQATLQIDGDETEIGLAKTQELHYYPWSTNFKTFSYKANESHTKTLTSPSFSTSVSPSSQSVPYKKSAIKKTKSCPNLLKKSVRFDKQDYKQICMFDLLKSPQDIETCPKFYIKDSPLSTSGSFGEEDGEAKDSIGQFLLKTSSSDDSLFSYSSCLMQHAPSKRSHDSISRPKVYIQRTNVPNYFTPFSVSGKNVQIESVSLLLDSASQRYVLKGLIRVKNLAFEKRVFLRYTTNNWKSFSEQTACFVQTFQSEDGRSAYSEDQFEFEFDLNDLFFDGLLELGNHQDKKLEELDGKVFEFALRYEVQGALYWDNHENLNYEVVFGC
jgi:hypothetical protein